MSLAISQAPAKREPMSLQQILGMISGHEHDHEFYPTDSRMLKVVKDHCGETYAKWLDIGCGIGAALIELTDNENGRYGIEKSRLLLNEMCTSITLVGTEFEQQTLVDLPMDYIFINPPYSQFAQFLSRTILEANAKAIYAIVPTRWSKSDEINEAIKRRKAKATILDTTDFLDAPRKARAKVDIIHIDLKPSVSRTDHERGDFFNSYRSKGVDPFDLWFDTHFKIEADKESTPDYRKMDENASTLKSKVNELSSGYDLVANLVTWYNEDMEKLLNTYKQLCTLDASILKELDVSIDKVKEALKLKIAGLKANYWKEFFNNFKKLTSRFTQKSRDSFMARLNSNLSIDFTARNCHALALCCLKQANKYMDGQLLEVFDDMVSASNVVAYKSNKRVFSDKEWRWSHTREQHTHYGLDLRIVVSSKACINHSVYNWEAFNGLDNRGHNFLSDLLTIANNLGFDCIGDAHPTSRDYFWDSNKLKEFTFKSATTGKLETLFSVRVFHNGNCHIKFNQNFLLAMNIAVGQLKGWLYTESDASTELNVKPEDVKQFWKSQSVNKFVINDNSSKLLTVK